MKIIINWHKSFIQNNIENNQYKMKKIFLIIKKLLKGNFKKSIIVNKSL